MVFNHQLEPLLSIIQRCVKLCLGPSSQSKCHPTCNGQVHFCNEITYSDRVILSCGTGHLRDNTLIGQREGSWWDIHYIVKLNSLGSVIFGHKPFGVSFLSHVCHFAPVATCPVRVAAPRPPG